ncbi:nucleotide kinase [Klebsiella phage VLCpiA1d]|nr:nucleotide kinase [Klebsiella phage VLCpiA1d]
MSKFKIGDMVVRKDTHITGSWSSMCETLGVSPRAPVKVTGIDGTLILLNGESVGWRDDYFYPAAEVPTPTQVADAVNSPQHYQFFPDLEAIVVIARSMTQEQFYGYCLGNRLKYRLRAGNKDKLEQDIAKSDKYSELYEKHRGKCIDAK